jgi:dGTPase
MKTTFDIQRFLREQEEKLSPYAAKSAESPGRKHPLKNDPFRLEFARDENRIIHSPPFRRLKHKTQVFLSPDNDHICTRMEHVLHVSSIAAVIGRCLNLNIDLINAIAKGHDLGHPPFGHSGEEMLDTILKREGVKDGFKHEIHGLRVVDMLTNYGAGLNLTYEVRDGIITHCGERFERFLAPDRSRDLRTLELIDERGIAPATLEGCLVRMVDRIAYLGRDLEDALKAGLIKKADIPSGVARELGTDNGKIIGRFVNDTIEHSIEKDAVEMSAGVFELMNELKKFNYTRIYRHPEVVRIGQKANRIIEQLYAKMVSILRETRRGRDGRAAQAWVNEAPCLRVFFDFIKNTNYTDSTPEWRIAADYIAGMTDSFAERTFIQIFMPTRVI